MSEGMQVSVIIAVKNGADTLQRCLDSIFMQRTVRAETVVVDGDSTDGTTTVLRANASRLAFFSSEPDSGIYAAWNKALERACGEWICFISCDDVFHDELALHDLVVSAAAMKNSAGLVYGKVNLMTPRGVVAETVGRPWQYARDDFLSGVMIPGPAALHHRSLFERHGRFDESYRIAGDYEFLLRELRLGAAGFVDRVAIDMRLQGVSNRPGSIHLMLREVVRARKTHGMSELSPRLRLALATSWIGARVFRLMGATVFGVLADAYRLVRGKPRVWTV